MGIFYRRTVQNIAIICLIFIGFKNFIISLPLRYSQHFSGFYQYIDTKDTMFMQGKLAFVVSLVMILLAYNLYKRMRMAWIGEIFVLVVSIVLQAIYFHAFALHMIIVEAIILLILVISVSDFSRKSQRSSIKKVLIYIVISFVLLMANATFSILLIHGDLDNLTNLSAAFSKSIKLMVMMDKSVLNNTSSAMILYGDSLIFLFWFTVLAALVTLLKPLAFDAYKNKNQKERAHAIILKYGQNPMSYLAIEDDKYYFFGETIEGVCAYTIVGNVMVICGDIICKSSDAVVFLEELILFSKRNHYDLILLNITNEFIDLYKSNQFGTLKYGEDACFKLEDYDLKGGAVAKVRAAINHANKAGIAVYEYKPLEARDVLIEKQIMGISEKWLNNKAMPEMKFMLGSISLEAPRERRYFYAADSNGEMLGFVVFLPYMSSKAYLAEVTRRKTNAPQGVLEKIIYDAFMVMKDEGVTYGNMGLSPLYNVSENENQSISEKISTYIYEHLNEAYDFKSLHHAKEKYAPTHWESRYIAYYPKPMTLKYAYAIVKAQNPVTVLQMIKAQLKKRSDGS